MKNNKLILSVPGGDTTVLLHTCCAPCSASIIEALTNNGIVPVIYYSNSNIYPFEEYLKRKAECTRYAESKGLTVIDDDYSHAEWRKCVAGLESEPERGARCLVCFKQRLVRAAEYAHLHGIKVLTTTLMSSRWKNLDMINEAGKYACSLYPDVIWWDKNWRKGGLYERRAELIKEMNFYNQTYCGCEFSLRQSLEKNK